MREGNLNRNFECRMKERRRDPSIRYARKRGWAARSFWAGGYFFYPRRGGRAKAFCHRQGVSPRMAIGQPRALPARDCLWYRCGAAELGG